MPTPAKNFKIRGQPCWGQTLTTVFVVTNNPTSKLKKFTEGRGGGQVVSVLALYSNDPSSNPAEAYSFYSKICVWKNENKQKEAGVGPF